LPIDLTSPGASLSPISASSIDVFDFGASSVRTTLIDGEPVFVAADVLSVLEVDRTALRRLDKDEKGVVSIHTLGGPQQVTVVNEPGLYALILSSRKKQARDFKRWITHSVLPEIRRTGKYVDQRAQHHIPQTYAQALEVAYLQARELEHKELLLAQQQPKVDAYDALMDAEGYYSMEAVAKIIGIGRNTLFKHLRDMRVIEPAPSRLPYQRYMRYFTVTASPWSDKDGNTNVSYTPKVHPRGLRFILASMGNRSSQSNSWCGR
jgi:anti-repressor protein